MYYKTCHFLYECYIKCYIYYFIPYIIKISNPMSFMPEQPCGIRLEVGKV